MTRESIREAALNRFAEQGYEATTMAEIAGDVGIKAPAIYAHFKNKEELYRDVLRMAIERELVCTRKSLEKAQCGADLIKFLRATGPRFEATLHLRFLLRAAYLPPHGLADKIKNSIHAYMEGTEKAIYEAILRIPSCRLTPQILASAFSGIIDNLQCETLYAGMDTFAKRADAYIALLNLAFESEISRKSEEIK